MAELLNQPSLWRDSDGNSPPRQWNGTQYEFLESDILTFTGTVQDGDTVTLNATSTAGVFYAAAVFNQPDAPDTFSQPVDSIASNATTPASKTVTVSSTGNVYLAALAAYPDGAHVDYYGDVVLVPPAVPVPASIGSVVRQHTTHRIARGYDGVVTCYVRNESGPQDLSLRTLTVSVRAYGKDRVLWTGEATQESAGKVSFTVPADVTVKQLPNSLFRFDMEADGYPVYQALIEIV